MLAHIHVLAPVPAWADIVPGTQNSNDLDEFTAPDELPWQAWLTHAHARGIAGLHHGFNRFTDKSLGHRMAPHFAIIFP
jgi:hypothetical protein